MRKIKIAVDPLLKEKYGPEVCWTWRLLLSGIGLPWEEVPMNSSKCDIVYAIDHGRADYRGLSIRANIRAWDQRSSNHLGSVCESDGVFHPVYEGESASSRLFDLSNGCLICERDLIFDVFWLATGQEEQYWPRNEHGHFDLGGTALQREQALRLALGSSIGSGLEKILVKLGLTAPLPRWPHGKRAAACMGHDVDYPEVVRWLEPLRIVRRQGLNGLAAAALVLSGRKSHWHFSSWVRMEQSLNIRSAFYFVPRQGSLLGYAAGTPDPFYDVQSDRFKNLFKYLADEGVEIGLHASYRSCESEEKFAAEKEQLEEASGQKICGSRHHYWRLKPDDPESTLLVHEKTSLKYDSSLIHERYLGWRRGLCWPFFPFHQKQRRELKTLQISTAWMDDQLFGHQEDNPGDRIEILRALAGKVAEQGGCLNVDIHDYVFDESLFPGWAKTYRELCEYLRAQSDFWVAPPYEIAEHWIQRHAAITDGSRGLTGTC
jgi:hypothetical protein